MQSSPPENKTATRVLPAGSEAGGSGILRTLNRSDSTSCCRSKPTEGESLVNGQLLGGGSALLNLPMPETCNNK